MPLSPIVPICLALMAPLAPLLSRAVPKTSPATATEDAANAPGPEFLPQPLHPQAQAVNVVIRSSIEAALTAASGRPGRSLSAEVARLLRWRGKLSRLTRPGDRLSLLYAPPSAGAPAGAGGNPVLLGLQYQGERLNLNAYRFAGADGIFRYYDAQGQLIEPLMVQAPVPAYEQITEIVQHGRGLRHHRGVDLKAPEGAQVVLPFSGTVTRMNWARRYNGRCIEIKLDAGYLAHFLHLQQVSPALRVGAHLPAGTALGTVGNTGHSSGPHLHYELLRANRPVEPLIVHGRRVVMLGPEAQKSFASVRDAMIRAMAQKPWDPIVTSSTGP